MNKNQNIGAILLVVGTTIGSGMMALPLILSPIGLVFSILLMVVTWWFSYVSALINLELNLQAGGGLSLGHLAKFYQCHTAEYIGTISLKLLSYGLMVVFIFGGSEIILNLLKDFFNLEISFNSVAIFYSLFLAFLLMCSISWIDYANRFLFTGLFVVLAVLAFRISTAPSIDFYNLMFLQKSLNSSSFAILPVLFTSFGFHVIFHTLTKYCKNNPKVLKNTFFWGSLLPVIIYIFWTLLVILALYENSFDYYTKMIEGNMNLGELIQALSNAAKWPLAQMMSWIVCILAIVTSAIGVGIGLNDTWKDFSFLKNRSKITQNFVSLFLTICIPLMITITIPNAFINLLSFAGMILVIIAIFIPIYILRKSKLKIVHYEIINSNKLQIATFIFGIMIVISEFFNLKLWSF